MTALVWVLWWNGAKFPENLVYPLLQFIFSYIASIKATPYRLIWMSVDLGYMRLEIISNQAAIKSGKLKPGDRLIETGLATALMLLWIFTKPALLPQ